MYKYIVLCLCVCLSGVLCDLNKDEGADCEWDGVKGKCVKETQCVTTLDIEGEKHLVCSKKDDVTFVCCTDCELVNSTRNVVMSPTSGFYWKDGTKARDSCLEYLDTLPYACLDEAYYSGIWKVFDEDQKCHRIAAGLWPPPGPVPIAKYPHQAMLGYGKDLASAQWKAGGTIISNKYILTAAHVNIEPITKDGPKFVALGVKKRSASPTAWQTRKVKRFIPHPDYKHPSKYNDIGLIETETPITFNEDVLPACLHVEAANTETAIVSTWRDLRSASSEMADRIQTINLEEYNEDECGEYVRPNRHLKDGMDYETQMCYGNRFHAPRACRALYGDPLMIHTQFSTCIYTIIGVTSFGTYCSLLRSNPDVFTRVAHYKPWIESIVWA